MPPAQLLAVLRLILARLQLYTQACAEFHWRVYGSSLLIVYEGDTQKLQQALPNATAGPECEKEEADEDGEEFNEDDQTEVDGKKWAYTLKGIDFAHAWPAKDVDQGYVAGLETLKGLLQQRIDALEQSLQ